MTRSASALVAALRIAWWMARGSHVRLWLLIACIAIGVAARVGVGSLGGLVTRTMALESRPLLGADLEISSYQPLTGMQRAQLDALLPVGARLQEHLAFVTMADAPESGKATAVEVRAIPSGYPLVGNVRVEPAGASDATAPRAPLFGSRPSIYVERGLLARLDLHIGSLVRLGSVAFPVAGVLLEEPGLGQNPFAIGPTVLMADSALPGTGLGGDGARIRHCIMITTVQLDQADRLVRQLRERWGLTDVPASSAVVHPANEWAPTIRTARTAQDSLAHSFERLSDYMNLVTVMALLLGGTGVAILMHGFMEHHRDATATVLMLGATSGMVSLIFFVQALGVGIIGGLIGALCGSAGANLAVPWLSADLPLSCGIFFDGGQLAWGVALGAIVATTFAAFPLIRFSQSTPQARARAQAAGWLPQLVMGVLAVVAIALLCLVAAHEAGSWRVGSLFIVGVGIGGLVIHALGSVGIWMLSRLTAGPFPLRYGLANLGRPGLGSATAILAIGMSTLLFSILTIYQESLVNELSVHAQSELPSLFLIDIQDEQCDGVRALLAHDYGIMQVDLQPRVRGRLRGVIAASKPSGSAPDPGPGPRNREQNLSWRTRLGGQERLTAGVWMDDESPRIEASLEQRFADNLGARLGDTVSFDVQGVRIDALVTSLRMVHWTSFQPNFFVLLSPHALSDAPKSWVAALPALSATRREQVQDGLARHFPGITVFDVSEVATRINDILGRIVTAVRLVALSCVAAGMVVLAGLALSSGRVRRGDAALLKLLGAGHATLLLSLGCELVAIGIVSALIGVGLAIPIAWLLMHMLSLPMLLPWLPLAQLAGAALLVSLLAGLISCVSVLGSKPLAVLREA